MQPSVEHIDPSNVFTSWLNLLRVQRAVHVSRVHPPNNDQDNFELFDKANYLSFVADGQRGDIFCEVQNRLSQK